MESLILSFFLIFSQLIFIFCKNENFVSCFSRNRVVGFDGSLVSLFFFFFSEVKKKKKKSIFWICLSKIFLKRNSNLGAISISLLPHVSVKCLLYLVTDLEGFKS